MYWDYRIGNPGPNNVSYGSNIFLVKTETFLDITTDSTYWPELTKSTRDVGVFERIGLLDYRNDVPPFRQLGCISAKMDRALDSSLEIEIKIFEEH
jgi:hypothetical protein